MQSRAYPPVSLKIHEPHSRQSLGLQHDDDAHVEATVAETIATIRQLKTLKAELKILSNSVEAVVEELSNVAQPTILRLSIAKVPPELLSRIIELSEPRDQIHLSSVCRRFRAVALKNPRLWRHVSNRQDPEWRKTLLSRSGACGLFVGYNLDGSESSRACELFWDSVLQCPDRWEGVTISQEITHFDSESSQLSPSSKLSGLYLPRLRSLNIYGDTGENVDWDICRTWKMPALQHVEVDAMFLARPFDVSSRLVSLTIIFYDEDPLGFRSIAANMCGLLSSVASTLRELTIVVLVSIVHSEIDNQDGHAATPPHPSIILPNLDLFRLSIEISNSANAIFTHILPYIYMPNLTHMRVLLDLWETPADTLWLDWFTGRGRIGARLKEVHVTLMGVDKYAKMRVHDGVEDALREYWKRVLKLSEVDWPRLTFA